jgi:hypothetical protein
MLTKILVTGGEPYTNARNLHQEARFRKAKIVLINLDKSSCETLLNYESWIEPGKIRAHNSIFAAGYRSLDKLYLCTNTEVFVYKYPDMELIAKASYPFFQNIHCVSEVAGFVGVASTGLDMVILLDKFTLKPITFKNVLGKDPWHKHSPNIDYRRYISLKPHESHPNFLFELDGEIWVTRCQQRDVVCLDNMDHRIEIGGGTAIHDGIVDGKHIYFSGVDGRIIIVNKDTLNIEEVVDLNAIEATGRPLGWCRGLLVRDGIAYVGLSRLRNTNIKENIKWLLRFGQQEPDRYTRIGVYDLKKRKKLTEFIFDEIYLSGIYSILPA